MLDIDTRLSVILITKVDLQFCQNAAASKSLSLSVLHAELFHCHNASRDLHQYTRPLGDRGLMDDFASAYMQPLVVTDRICCTPAIWPYSIVMFISILTQVRQK